MSRNDLVIGLIEKGMTIEEASHKILNAMATENDDSQVTTNLMPYLSASDENPLIKNAKARAEGAVTYQ